MPFVLMERTLAATLNASEAMARVWDVVIVGAGPAGALAARQVAQQGAAVLLVDRADFPRWKVCGCCLNPAALSVLNHVGLGHLPAQLGARPLDRLHLAAGGRSADCSIPAGASLSREALDAALIEAAIASGAQFLPHTEAALAPSKPSPSDADRKTSSQLSEFRALHLRRHETSVTVQARVVIAAEGLAGRLLHDEPEIAMRITAGSRMGAGAVMDNASPDFEDGVIYMASGHDGYVGMVRLEDGRLDVAAALDRDAVRRSGHPGALAVSILHEAGMPVPTGLNEATWRGTPPLTRRPAQLYADRLLVVGDAAGYIEPFTGEGMAWALAGAAAVAPCAVAGASHWSQDIGRDWQARHHGLIQRRQHVCHAVSRLLRRPRWCALAVRVLKYSPRLMTPVVRAIHRPFTDLPLAANARSASNLLRS